MNSELKPWDENWKNIIRYEKVPQEGYFLLPLFFIVRTAWSLVFDTYVPCVSILEVTFHFTELYQFSCLYTKVAGERCFEMIYLKGINFSED